LGGGSSDVGILNEKRRLSHGPTLPATVASLSPSRPRTQNRECQNISYEKGVITVENGNKVQEEEEVEKMKYKGRGEKEKMKDNEKTT
jgi:hypothetical protein